jgi:2-polyprenyl-6-hydroxyphenyl methylase/3-demethylubiquinone-9 3-methyltransferase
MAVLLRARNDPRQYDDLSDDWWEPFGRFAMLQWVAEARAALVPRAPSRTAVLVDVGCGAGLISPHLAGKGYRQIGVDLSEMALPQAASHGVLAIRGNVLDLPLGDEVADVVVAGEILEHVSDLQRALAEACRILRPGGLLVIDTIAATALAKLVAIGICEHVPGGPPRGIHDPELLVNRRELVRLCASNGVPIQLRGIRPSLPRTIAWLLHLKRSSQMVPTFTSSILFQAWGRKRI